ncbi:phospholipase A2 large subunit-like [Temnothorax nylanderi]|uniref:phospholipase A2 large subunit-like n=1 Tax=Temnothorax nylanderi TaxID=102681 RepID=UPI003A88D203
MVSATSIYKAESKPNSSYEDAMFPTSHHKCGSILGKNQARTFPKILPGTLWCGVGNMASSYEELGLLSALDACCQDHDYCPESIAPGQYDVTGKIHNPTDYTMSRCYCDEKFRNCLKNTNGWLNRWPAAVVKWLYFDYLQMRCF